MAGTGRRVEVFKDAEGFYRWHVRAANGEIVADSAEGYARRVDCLRMAQSLNPDLPVDIDGEQ